MDSQQKEKSFLKIMLEQSREEQLKLVECEFMKFQDDFYPFLKIEMYIEDKQKLSFRESDEDVLEKFT